MVTLSPLTNLKELRSRLGLFFYYRQYIKGFSDITKPMYELTREENGKAVPFEWTAARQKAFETIKAKLATVPVELTQILTDHLSYIRTHQVEV